MCYRCPISTEVDKSLLVKTTVTACDKIRHQHVPSHPRSSVGYVALHVLSNGNMSQQKARLCTLASVICVLYLHRKAELMLYLLASSTCPHYIAAVECNVVGRFYCCTTSCRA